MVDVTGARFHLYQKSAEPRQNGSPLPNAPYVCDNGGILLDDKIGTGLDHGCPEFDCISCCEVVC